MDMREFVRIQPLDASEIYNELLPAIADCQWNDDIVDMRLNNPFFPFYEELFIDLAFGAENASDQCNSLYRCDYKIKHPEAAQQLLWFEKALFALSFSTFDIMIIMGMYDSNEANQLKQDAADDIAQLSKKDAFDLLFRTFDYLMQVQQLRATHQSLLVLLGELSDNNDVEFEEIQNGQI